MALEAGYLRVTLNYAMGIKHCDWFGYQDPYCMVRLGSKEARSRVCRGAGRNPVWGDDETFHFTVTTETSLQLTLMDEDRGLTDDLIGTATIDLAMVRARGQQVVQAPVTKGKRTDKYQGIVQVSLEFVPSVRRSTVAAAAAAPRQPVAAGAPPPQPQVDTAAAAAWPGYNYPPARAPVVAPPAQPPANGYGYRTPYPPGAVPVMPAGAASPPYFSPQQPVH